MANKKISELASATTPLSGAELIEIVQSGTNKQVAASALIGAAGPEGDPGAPGADGLDGSDGADGRTVLSGPGAPSSGLGANGDFYIDTTDWDIYGPKTVGAWGSGTSLVGPAGAPGADGLDGSDGAAGADGADGVDGRTVLSGTGAPSSGLGANGDFYIDTTDWDIYGPKTAGAWGAGTSLIGSSAANLATVAHAATSKTPPVDADELSLIDSAASYGLKKLTWANLKATIWSSLGALIAGGTAKTTPVDGDGIAIADSAASSATKYLTLANLWTNLFKGKADALYAVIAKGVTNGDSHDHSGGDGAQIAYSGLSGLPTLGTAAAKNTGASGDAVPLCNVANTWAENQTFGKAAGFDDEISPSATTGSITVDWRYGNRCKFTPTGNCTLSFTAPGVHGKLTLIVTSGATPYTITQPGSTVAMGDAPSTVANKDTMYQYDWDGSEYRWMGVTEK